MKTRQFKRLRRPIPQLAGGTGGAQGRADSDEAMFQGLQKDIANLIPGASVVSPIGGYAKSALQGTEIGDLAAGFVDPSQSLSRVWADARNGNVSWNTVWDLALPGVGNWMHRRDHHGDAPDPSTVNPNQGNLADNLKNGYMQANPGGSINNYTNPYTAAMGGVVPGGKVVSLERNEVTLGPDGTMKKWSLPPHPNKSRIPLSPNTLVFSDDDRFIMPEGKTPAQAAAPLQKVVNDRNATTLARRSAERRLGNIYSFQTQRRAELEASGKFQQTYTDNIPEAAGGTNWGKTFDTIGKVANVVQTVAPIVQNAVNSNKSLEVLDPASFQNPLAYAALDTYKNMRSDVNPALQATDAMSAAADQNLRSTATGRGQYMSGRIGLANAGMTAKAGIYSQAQRERNGYLGQYANAAGQYGQKMADTNLMISDLNARNAAAQRQYGSAAASQLSQWAQIQQQMRNQKATDEMIASRYSSYSNMLGVYNTNKTAAKSGSINTGKGYFGNYGTQVPSYNANLWNKPTPAYKSWGEVTNSTDNGGSY
jgi:hypothetical protein